MSLLVFWDGWKVVWMKFLFSKRFWLQRRADMMKVTHLYLFENWRENNTSKQLSQFNFCFRPLFPCDKKGSQRYKCPSAPQWHLAKSAPTKVLCQIIQDFPVSLLWPHGNLRCTIFWGVLKLYVEIHERKFSSNSHVNWFQLAWNKESQFALWILSRLLEFRNATDDAWKDVTRNVANCDSSNVWSPYVIMSNNPTCFPFIRCNCHQLSCT